MPTIDTTTRRDGSGTLAFGFSPNWAAGVYASYRIDFGGRTAQGLRLTTDLAKTA